MTKQVVRILIGFAATLTVMMTGCGGSTSAPPAPTPAGSVVLFGTDVPACNLEAFVAAINSAILVPQGGGNLVPLVSSTAPATVNFARLADFTNIISTASVPPGKYSQLQLSLSGAYVVALDTSTNPPSVVEPGGNLTPTSLTLTINPPLVVSGATTSGVTFDFNLRKSLQVDGSGQLTGVVNPQITVTTNSNSGSTVGEADALYGIAGAPSTANLPSGFTGSFPLTLDDGTFQTLNVLVNSDTVFEGDGVTSLAGIAANDFVEVDAVVNTSGEIVAQIVDGEEPTSLANVQVALLGSVIGVARDGSGNATAFSLLVEDEDPLIIEDDDGSGPIAGAVYNATLTSSTHYFTNWRQWNQQSFTFGPQTLGLGQNVAVFGAVGSTPGAGFFVNQIFLRPQSVQGSFKSLQAAESDGVTGAFTAAPCSSLWGGQAITVLSYPDTVFNGLGGLTALTPTPVLDMVGLLFYPQTSGTSNTGGSWPAPAWVMQAREVHQLPN